MKNLNKYIRVGIDYFKEVVIPMTGEDLKVLKRWNKQTIVDDFGKDAISKIENFEGFCFKPAHEKFEKVINGFTIVMSRYLTNCNQVENGKISKNYCAMFLMNITNWD